MSWLTLKWFKCKPELLERTDKNKTSAWKWFPCWRKTWNVAWRECMMTMLWHQLASWRNSYLTHNSSVRSSLLLILSLFWQLRSCYCNPSNTKEAREVAVAWTSELALRLLTSFLYFILYLYLYLINMHISVEWAQVMVRVRLRDNIFWGGQLSLSTRKVPRVKSDPWGLAANTIMHLGSHMNTMDTFWYPDNILSKSTGFFNNLMWL